MKTLRDIENLNGVRVFLRLDLNLPIKNGVVMDDFRIRSVLPTIEHLRKGGAKIIIASHLEVLEGEKATLAPVVDAFKKNGVPVTFVKDYKKAFGLIEDGMKDGECILLENLRDWEGEKKNNAKFAKELASLADIYVNEAFPVSHREHASIVGVPKLIPSYAGYQFEKEVEHLSKAFKPAHPFLFILAGAKFDTKIRLVNKFLAIADDIFIGGAIANDFFRAKGYEVGKSTLSKGDFDLNPLLDQAKIILPTDVVDQDHKLRNPEAISANDSMLDIGPESVKTLGGKIKGAKFILWNGTLGYCEKGFPQATDIVAKMIVEATKNGATSIVGGGDTVAALNAADLESGFSFVSTAGGAMLDFLANGTLPGIEALAN